MQEIKKRRIVLASVLKPVTDPRMFEKIGQSLARKYEVHIIGSPGKRSENHPTIFFHALSPFKRLSFSRLLAPLKVLTRVLQLKPALLIICTHELLYIALLAKILVPCKIIYDIQENYWRNIFYTRTFPFYLRPFMATYVRLKEWSMSPFQDFYFLAEIGYEQELKFTGSKKIVLENKLKKSALPVLPKKSKSDGNIHLLFSGTIAETTGVFIAIEMATKLHEIDPRIRLLIIGYCAIPQTAAQIKSEIAKKPFIELIIGDIPIGHQQILYAIQTSDFGIIAYPPNPSTASSIPTKLYEYLGYQLPILLARYEPWLAICDKYNAAIPFNPGHFNGGEMLKAMQDTPFYLTQPADVFWDSEEKNLLQTVAILLPANTPPLTPLNC